MNVFQRKYEKLDEQILKYVKMNVFGHDEFSARLDFLRLQKNKITELLSRQKAAKKDFCTEKENTQKALCAIDPLYQEAKKF